jgi:hypothetical protein
MITVSFALWRFKYILLHFWRKLKEQHLLL